MSGYNIVTRHYNTIFTSMRCTKQFSIFISINWISSFIFKHIFCSLRLSNSKQIPPIMYFEVIFCWPVLCNMTTWSVQQKCNGCYIFTLSSFMCTHYALYSTTSKHGAKYVIIIYYRSELIFRINVHWRLDGILWGLIEIYSRCISR